ncbi:MAG TPA: ferritin-like domain-containing protein [Acidobacteriota bacterium]|nr:ferritin-like domain-containing protein [Acidobacteriota bacterium]
MKMENLENLYLHTLQDLHSAEQQLIENLPKMANAASSQELKRAFNEHLEETKRQLQRVEGLFKDLGEKPGNTKCKGMEGIIREGEELLKEKGTEKAVLDAALICAAQKAEHYEIATYGTARTFAHELGHDEAAKTLDQILTEESKTNEKLTKIAENTVNRQAAKV